MIQLAQSFFIIQAVIRRQAGCTYSDEDFITR